MTHVARLAALVILVALVGCSSGGTQHQQATATRPQASEDSATSNTLKALSLLREGSVQLEQGRYEEALAQFNEADRIAPGNATTHNLIGMCYLQMQQYDRALAAFNTALELAPSFTDVRNNRGAAYLALEQYRMAEVDFLAVLGDPTYPHRWEAYYNLGMAYLRRGEVGAAEENIRRAVTAPVPVYDAYLRLAEINEQRGTDSVAADLYEEARLKFPDRFEATFGLGRLMARQGRMDEARPLLEEVIEAAPRSEMAREASELLAMDG